ncbi:MAG: bifunctional riboflavin kinase/FAD synthetase [Clostridiaceae bacterium]|nr:bifunctional riboflavin kinase/FAD synthetase [Clostridiaceae bacterium]
MEVVYKSKNFAKPLGIGLGNFDGLHIGHMTLVNILISESKLNNLHSMIYTFTEHPNNILKNKPDVPILITTEKKTQLLSNLELDYLFYEEFDETFSRLQPEEFIKEILVRYFDIKLAVVGFDYVFGHKGRGNAGLLKKLGQKYGFKVIVIPPIKVNNNIVSSTLIRECISCGDMENALYFLGRHYSVTGTVKRGKGIGSELGFPTANISTGGHILLPACGVYITRTLVNGNMYKSVTNVGMNPTINPGNTKVDVETFILDFDEDIYDKQVEVFFVKKIRDEKRFKNR